MKIAFLVFFIQAVVCISWAKSFIDVPLLQTQLRYEDTSAQSKESVNYQSFSVAYQMDILRFGIFYGRHLDSTGNASFNVDNEKKEYAGVLGCQVFHTDNQNNINFDIFAQTLIGSSQSQVMTKLFGASSTSSSNTLMFGAGAAAIGRLSYLLLETDMDFLTASSYSPQIVPAVTFKIGFSISL